MKPNPPIKGHELINEGALKLIYATSSREWVVVGGCRCGALPDDVARTYPADVRPTHVIWFSAAATKRWHREHKEAVRRGDA